MPERKLIPFDPFRREKPVPTGVGKLVPETVEHTGGLLNEIQRVLVEAYGLKGMNLSRPSDFLWPRRTSQAAETRIQLRGEEDAFYISDGWDLESEGMFGYLGNLPVLFSPRVALFKRGLLPFEGLNPVIHLGTGLNDRLRDSRLTDLIAPDKVNDLELAVEEVGHFLYEQTQYRLHRKIPGRIIQEGMALLNIYLVLNRVAEEAVGKNAAAQMLREKMIRSLEALRNGKVQPAMDFWLKNQYAKGSLIVGGFLIHISENDQAGVDNKEEFAKFYRLTGPEKARYLRDLYAKYVQAGDKRYNWSLDTIISRLELDKEFIDEEQRKDNVNRKRLSLEATQAKEDELVKRLSGEDRKQLK